MLRMHNPGAQLNSAGWLTRETRAKAKLERANDPTRLIVTRIRHHDASLVDAERRAREEYRLKHANVPSPLPEFVHPQIADLVLKLMTENGLLDRDLSLPLVDHGETQADMIARYRADSEAEYQEMVGILADKEREKALDRLHAAQAELAALDVKQSAYGVSPAAKAETGTVSVPEPIEPAKRGPGRPPKPPRISLDRDATDDALPVNL